MDFKAYKTLSLNGRKRSLQEWRAHAQQQLQEGYGLGELEGILEFVVSWSDRKEWIETRTSGSTGRPKNIKIRKEHIIASAIRTLDFLGLKSGDSALLCIPDQFIGGKMMIARSIIGELDLYIADNSSTPELPTDKSIDFAALIPMQAYHIAHDKDLKKSWQGVKKIIIGGGHLDPALEEELSTWKGEVYESFGMTETISHIALRKIGSGEKEPFVTFSDIVISQDERGCLIIESELLPTNPLVTNDIVELIDEKSFRWMGRADNLINSGGVKIIPEVIEKLAKPHVNANFIFAGVPDEELGQKVVLLLESQPMSDDDQADLLKELRKELHKYEMPKEIHYIDAFVETDNGKVNRKKTLKLIEA